jgi:hypothetical protein
MTYQQIGILETNVIDYIKTCVQEKKPCTFEDILDKTGISRTTLTTIIESLVAKGTVEVVESTDEETSLSYKLRKSIERPIILEGNIFLPVSVIEFPERGTKLVTRGNWYELPIDFDIDRIIWNISIDPKQKSTLMDLIATSISKERTTKNVQLPEYQMLVNKEVPYSNTMNLRIKVVGETVTDITIVFKVPISTETITEDIKTVYNHTGFTVNSKISTAELIGELKKKPAERDYHNIKINRLFNITDFVFSGNEFPIEYTDEGLRFAKITGIRGGFELTYYRIGASGNKVTTDKEQYDDASTAISRIIQMFNDICNTILQENDITCEYMEYGDTTDSENREN